MKIWKIVLQKFLAVTSILLIFLNTLTPLALAQEIATSSSEVIITSESEESQEIKSDSAPTESLLLSSTELPTTPTPAPSAKEEVVVEPIPEPTSEASTSANPVSSPNPTPTLIELIWTENAGSYTTEILKLNATYKFPPNEKVSLTFTKLPENSGTITVHEHDVPSTVEGAGSKDYEIISNMPNNSFSFDLTLPTNDPTKSVLTSSDGQNYDEVTNETVASSDTVTIKGITHLTHFIVADVTANFNHPVINEFVSNTSGGEWIELYNPTSETIDLLGWELMQLSSPNSSPSEAAFLALSGEIPAKSFIIAAGSGLNNTGDWIGLYNSSAELVDQMSFGDVAAPYNVNVVDNPSAEQSTGRTVDGGPDFQTFTSPTRGLSNGTILNTLYVDDDWTGSDNDDGHTFGHDAFSNIQDAINFAPTGSTINIAPGSYNESLTVDKSLTLIGNPGDTSVGVGENAPLVYSCGKVIRVEVSNVTISGFILDGQDCGDLIIRLGTNVTGAAISDNEIRSGYRGVAFGGGNNGVAASGSTVENNYIHSNSTGVRIDSGNNNVIQNNNITGNGEGILISANWSTPNSNQIQNNQITANDYGIYSEQSEILTISGNTISDNFYEGIYINYATSTLNITGNTIGNNQNGGSSGMYINQITSGSVTISQNSVLSNGQYGIYLWSVDSNSSVAISGNTIQNNSSSGIYLDSSVTNTTITENTIENNGFSSLSTGIVVNYALGNEAHENTISSNGDIEVQNDDNQNIFDATLNWWGTAVASEILAKLSGLVNFSPWYISSQMQETDNLRTGKAISSFDFDFPSVDGVINDTDHTVTLYVLNGTDMTNLVPSITVSDGASIYPESGAVSDFTNAVTYTVTAEDGFAQEYIVEVNVVAENQTVPDGNGNVTVTTNTKSQVIITSPTQPINLTISSGVTNPTIDYSSLITGGTGTIPQTTIDSTLADITIPASTVTSADPNWDGVIAAPKITTVTLPETAGETKTLSTAIEIGFSSAKLSFDKAVRILLPNQAGKRAGYTRPGTAFTEITNSCVSLDDQTAINADLVGLKEDCKIDSGLDLVIWTKHFTTFAAYTQTTNSASTSSSTTSGGGGGGGDGLGCAVRDCSIHPAVQNLSLGVSVLASGLTGGFGFGVLGISAEKVGEEIVIQDNNNGEIKGESTVANQPVQKKEFVGGLFGAILRFFGEIFGFIAHIFGR